MYIKLLNLQISTSLIAIILTIFAFLITLFFIIIFQVEDKTVSIINFYEQPVKVIVKGSVYSIPPFDTQVFTLNTSNGFDILVEDEQQNELQNIKIDGITRTQQLINVALSSNIGYCFFSSKITNDSNGNIVLEGKKNLNIEPTYYVVSGTNLTFEEYAFPGKEPEVAADIYTKPINYVYPISCNLINNDDNVIKTITAFSDYNAEEQLKYLQDIRSKIGESGSIDSLNSTLPGSVNKYYTSENNYLFVYQ